MTTYRMFQVDAFADRLFAGNPAGVLILDDWLDVALMQAIATENNLSETAFARRNGTGFDLRWFTPTLEVPFCGHATLATAHILATEYGVSGDIAFQATAVGTLTVRPAEPGRYSLDLPSLPPGPVAAPAALPALFPKGWDSVLSAGDNLYVVLPTESAVRDYQPDMPGILTLTGLSLCITAPGDGCDFVSRYFAPAVGIPEDPVTGSIHASLTPYWAERLGRTELQAVQASARGGQLLCRMAGDRVLVTGRAITFMEATIHLPD